VYAAYASAVANKGRADRHLGEDREGLRHGQGGRGLEHRATSRKKTRDEALRKSAIASISRFSDEEIAGLTFRKPKEDSEELKYLQEHRAALGGYLPARNSASAPCGAALEHSGPLLRVRPTARSPTTMALVRMLRL